MRRNRILRTLGALPTAFVAEATMAQESRPQAPEVEPPTEPREATPIAADRKPNVLFILADNVGYGDVGPYGGGIIIPGTPGTLPAHAFTMGEMFKALGYSTAIFGKWPLGEEPQSLPTAHGFDEAFLRSSDRSWRTV